MRGNEGYTKRPPGDNRVFNCIRMHNDWSVRHCATYPLWAYEMTDTELTALLSAICERPHDDALRLIYADRCEELELHERAEFVRVQLRLANLRCDFSHLDTCFDRRKTLKDVQRTGCKSCRAAVPLKKQSKWLAGRNPAPNVVHMFCSNWGWCRGFVEHITTTCTDWLAHGRDIVRQTPVTRVDTDRRPAVADHYCYWSLANQDAAVDEIVAFQSHLLPWDIYWAMSGAKGAYMAEYRSKAEALAALSSGCINWARTTGTPAMPRLEG